MDGFGAENQSETSIIYCVNYIGTYTIQSLVFKFEL